MAWIVRDLAEPLPADLTEHERATWCSGMQLVADLGLQRILFVPVKEAELGFRMPVAAMLDNRVANRELRRRWAEDWSSYSEDERDKGCKWFDDTSAAFREARVVVTDIRNATAEQAKDAFLHICKVGVPMSEKDFDAAVAWAL